MAAGSIIIDLLMRTGSFETDTKRAEKRLAEFQKQAAAFGQAVGVGFAAAGAAAAVMAKQLIDGIDALNDVADATGSSIENISALEDVALRTGSSLEAVSGMVIKFNGTLKEADGKNGPSLALQQIGLDVDALKKMDPAEAVMEVAKALAKYADDGDKARLVQELFGKSVKEVGPLLKDLAEKGQLVATVTTEQAKEAERFNQQLSAMQKNATDLGRSLVTDLVTGINAAAQALKESGLLEGFRTLFTGSDQFKNDKQLVDLTDKLLQAENRLAASKARDRQYGDTSQETAAAQRALDALNAQLRTAQAMRKVLDGTALAAPGAISVLPSVGAVPATAPKPPKAPGVSKGPQAKAFATSDRWDAVSAAAAEAEMMNEAMQAYADYTTKVDKATKAVQDHVQSWIDSTPEGKLALLQEEMQEYADALVSGMLTEEQYLSIVRERLDLQADGTKKVVEELTRAQETMEDFASIGLEGLRDIVVAGRDVDDVFKDILTSVANLLFQLMVVEPIMQSLRSSFSSGSGASGGGGGMWSSIISGIGSMFGGFMAEGGNLLPDRDYIVGENGPERFRPRTAGFLTPAGATAGGGVTINQYNTIGDVASMAAVDEKLRQSNRQLVATIDRSQRYGGKG